jgi:hypothetical protein
MQLTTCPRPSPLRNRLSAAACMLLAAGVPGGAHANQTPRWQFEGSALYYGEKGRARVVEPIARITRLFPDGQTLSLGLALDAISGASPSGALPTGRVQTTTTPSGRIRQTPADQVPVESFRDVRGSLDLGWLRPLGGGFAVTTGARYSRERDYQSLGGTLALSLECMQKLTTLKVGGGYNGDTVMPTGGTRVGLSESEIRTDQTADRKRVSTALVGASRVLTRRWMLSVDGSRSFERGYLTEPYKVVSVMNATSGRPTGELTEKRPDSRDRSAVLMSSVYHTNSSILYGSYRYYWDTWNVRSHTADLRWRHPFENGAYIQPHVRYYAQGPADFFRLGLVQGEALPEFVSADSRLGPLRSFTIGTTYGFHLSRYPGEWSVRAEYIHQFGDGNPKGLVGVQRGYQVQPKQDIGTLTAGYTVRF